MLLQKLPTELIQLIFQHCESVTTYMQLALSCRTLFEIASSLRETIMLYLYYIPGDIRDIEFLDTRALFRLFLKRAFANLYGVEFHADRRIFRNKAQAIEARISSFAPGDSPLLALVLTDDPTVYIELFSNQGYLYPRYQISSRRWKQPGKTEVLQTAFGGFGGLSGIYILWRYTPSTEPDEKDDHHPFVKYARHCTPPQFIFLEHRILGPSFPRCRICTFPEHADYEPLAFAASGDAFVISWWHMHDDTESVVMYTQLRELPSDEYEYVFTKTKSKWRVPYTHDGSFELLISWHVDFAYDSRVIVLKPGPVTRRTLELTFTDEARLLLFKSQSQPVYGTFQNIGDLSQSESSRPRLHPNSDVVRFSDRSSLTFSVDLPFFGTHDLVDPPEEPEPLCTWRYLAVGITRYDGCSVACILMSEQIFMQSSCGHVWNPGRGRRSTDWKVVARLLGYKKPVSTLGCIIAASKRGTRLAIADWDTIRLWVLEPHELILAEESVYYPSRFFASWDNRYGEHLQLRPTILHMEAVCFKLRFTDKEDELLAITDRGVMYWNLGQGGKGRRTVHRLGFSQS